MNVHLDRRLLAIYLDHCTQTAGRRRTRRQDRGAAVMAVVMIAIAVGVVLL